MGRLAKVLSWVTNAKIVVSKGAELNATCIQFTNAGEDSRPLPGDLAILVETPTRGEYAIAGYLDLKNPSTVGQGDKKLYSRDSAGTIKASVWLKNDGSLEIRNSLGLITMAVNGTINLNGVSIDASGNISTTGTITGGNMIPGQTVTLGLHQHAALNVAPTPGT